MKMYVYSAVILILAVVSVSGDVTCLDPKGKPVDWFVAYKLPKIKGTDPQTALGLSYVYLDVNKPVWQISTVPINATKHSIAYTISQLYNSKEDNMHLMYNDETPDGRKSHSRGHTKGVVGFGQKSGFWLIHSVPSFPPNTSYAYPESGRTNGQSFLCITLPTKGNFDLVMNQLLFTYPQIYSTNVPKYFAENTQLKAILNGVRKKSSEGSLVTLTSGKGSEFYSFAKSKEYNKDLYSQWMAPWLKSPVFVETWMNGINPLPSTCKDKYPVKNIRQLSFGGKYSFKETKDHAKWGVAENTPWTCIGGINRMKSQLLRCGGTVCFKNSAVHKSFKKIIIDADECKKKSFNNLLMKEIKFEHL